jgi:hypothetical protein
MGKKGSSTNAYLTFYGQEMGINPTIGTWRVSNNAKRTTMFVKYTKHRYKSKHTITLTAVKTHRH